MFVRNAAALGAESKPGPRKNVEKNQRGAVDGCQRCAVKSPTGHQPRLTLPRAVRMFRGAQAGRTDSFASPCPAGLD